MAACNRCRYGFLSNRGYHTHMRVKHSIRSKIRRKRIIPSVPSVHIRNLLGLDEEKLNQYRVAKKRISAKTTDDWITQALSEAVCHAPQGSRAEIEEAVERSLLLLSTWFKKMGRRHQDNRNVAVESPSTAMQFTFRYSAPLPCLVNDFYALVEHGLREHNAKFVKGQGSYANYSMKGRGFNLL